jgi:sec-independent protein translocase protein TatB
MFDVSFSELILILIVGLLVFGPEKLPEVVRTTGLWISKIKRSFSQIRSEIEREVGVDEIKREIHNQSILDSLKDVRNDLNQAHQNLRDLPYDVQDIVDRQHKPTEPVQFDTVSDDDFRHNEMSPIDASVTDIASTDTTAIEPQPTHVKPSASQSS